jgi:hypothetical protein
MRSIRKASPEVLNLLADCAPGVAQLALALRELVLAEAPEAEEVLYSVYAQVIVFRIPGRKHGAFCSVAAYARHVNLFFYHGATMPDPHGVLTGTGKQMRHIRFDSPDDLRHSYLSAYVRSALEMVGSPPTKRRSR